MMSQCGRFGWSVMPCMDYKEIYNVYEIVLSKFVL